LTSVGTLSALLAAGLVLGLVIRRAGFVRGARKPMEASITLLVYLLVFVVGTSLGSTLKSGDVSKAKLLGSSTAIAVSAGLASVVLAAALEILLSVGRDSS
jgi:uncharacterized membrane protein YbjE (DUF340 family)